MRHLKLYEEFNIPLGRQQEIKQDIEEEFLILSDDHNLHADVQIKSDRFSLRMEVNELLSVEETKEFYYKEIEPRMINLAKLGIVDFTGIYKKVDYGKGFFGKAKKFLKETTPSWHSSEKEDFIQYGFYHKNGFERSVFIHRGTTYTIFEIDFKRFKQ